MLLFTLYFFYENALYKFTVDIDIDIQSSTRRQCELGITLVINHVTCKISRVPVYGVNYI